MAGYPYMAEHSYGAAYGYSMAVDDGGSSHTSFIVWLIVFAVVAIAILGGLKVGGFSFVFRTR